MELHTVLDEWCEGCSEIVPVKNEARTYYGTVYEITCKHHDLCVYLRRRWNVNKFEEDTRKGLQGYQPRPTKEHGAPPKGTEGKDA